MYLARTTPTGIQVYEIDGTEATYSRDGKNPVGLRQRQPRTWSYGVPLGTRHRLTHGGYASVQETREDAIAAVSWGMQ